MAGLLNIGITGLGAAQKNLNTTAHNISNAGVENYSRQVVQQSTTDPMFTGVGFFGRGTSVVAVQRQYSQFLENQVLSTDNRRSELEMYGNHIAQINNLLADQEAGLSPALQNFFNGVQEVAANPSSVPARQAMISTAQSLVASFQSLDGRLGEIRRGVEGEIESAVAQINGYATSIAELNARIVLAQKAGPSVPANDLLDQRNLLIAELNRLIKTNTAEESDGSLSVFIGSGQSLVMGQVPNQLGALRGLNDPTRLEIALLSESGGSVRLPENVLNGGRLGGLLDFRRNSLDDTQNRLGLIAVGLAETFNAQHRLGVDLDGVAGGDFFRSPVPVLMPAIDTAVSIEDVSRLAPSDYLLMDEGAGNYTLIRLSDSTRLLNNQPIPADPALLDGLSITPGADPIPAAGVLIKPVNFAARNIAIGLVDARKVAAASPMSVEAPLSNSGNAVVSEIQMRSVDGMAGAYPFFPDFDLSFDAGANALVPPAGMTIERYNRNTQSWVAGGAYNPTVDAAGTEFRLTDATGFQFEFKITGAPNDGDVFQFQPTERGVADNRNAVALGALQNTKTLFSAVGGAATASYQSAYSQLVTTVGNKTREVQVGERAQEVLMRQAIDAREALSGVNLDEEAANLIRFQQAYQATGRVMSVAQRLFDELLSIAR